MNIFDCTQIVDHFEDGWPIFRIRRPHAFHDFNQTALHIASVSKAFIDVRAFQANDLLLNDTIFAVLIKWPLER